MRARVKNSYAKMSGRQMTIVEIIYKDTAITGSSYEKERFTTNLFHNVTNGEENIWHSAWINFEETPEWAI